MPLVTDRTSQKPNFIIGAGSFDARMDRYQFPATIWDFSNRHKKPAILAKGDQMQRVWSDPASLLATVLNQAMDVNAVAVFDSNWSFARSHELFTAKHHAKDRGPNALACVFY
jgi:hypothetical protein